VTQSNDRRNRFDASRPAGDVCFCALLPSCVFARGSFYDELLDCAWITGHPDNGRRRAGDRVPTIRFSGCAFGDRRRMLADLNEAEAADACACAYSGIDGREGSGANRETGSEMIDRCLDSCRIEELVTPFAGPIEMQELPHRRPIQKFQEWTSETFPTHFSGLSKVFHSFATTLIRRRQWEKGFEYQRKAVEIAESSSREVNQFGYPSYETWRCLACMYLGRWRISRDPNDLQAIKESLDRAENQIKSQRGNVSAESIGYHYYIT
jgi:hypothetical protein